MSELSAEQGRHFPVELSDAIERASSALADRLMHDGNSLSHAAEREAFARLVNDPSLTRVYAAGTGSVDVLDEYERIAVQELVPAAQARISPRARLRQALRPTARRVRARRSPHDAPGAQRAVWFALHHPKFLRFVLPLISEFGADRVGVLALSEEVQNAAAAEQIATRLVVPRVRASEPTNLLRPHLADLLESLRHALTAGGARAVLVCEGNAPSDSLIGIAARSLAIPSVCIQHGWAPVSNVGFRNLGHTTIAVWGEGFAELLAPGNPGADFAAVGNLSLRAEGTPGPLTERIGRGRGVLFSLQTVAPTIPRKAMVSFLEVIQTAATRLPDVPLLVREHPGHPLASLGLALPTGANIVDAHPARVALMDALDASFAVASISSTTLLEGVALLRPALIVDDLPYSPALVDWHAGLQVPSSAAVDALATLADPDYRRTFEPGMQRVREHFFAGARGDAAARLARLVDDLL